MKEGRPRACAIKDGKKGSTQTTMAVYAAESCDLEVHSIFCEACSQQSKFYHLE